MITSASLPLIGIILAGALLGDEVGADIMAVFPADHYIRDTAAFHQALDKGALLAQAGFLVTFGITPLHPDRGMAISRRESLWRSGGIKPRPS
jgi:mannose-1-phosphate guanylyltransferase / mannose-6-phosphate isomerase